MMNQSTELTKTATKVVTMASGGKKPMKEPGANFKIIKEQIRSLLAPTKPTLVRSSANETLNGYAAIFTFNVYLPDYLHLQSLGKKKKLSNIICFTSAGSDADALALPVGMYVRDTWGHNGTKILQMIERALGGYEAKNQASSASISKFALGAGTSL